MSTSRPLNYLITGAGRGIGRGLSRTLLNQGHRVLLVDSNESELSHTCAKLSQALPPYHPRRPSNSSARDASTITAQPSPSPDPSRQFHSLVADLRSQKDIQHIATTARTFFSNHLDVLVNNAAYTTTTSGASVIGGTSIRDRAGFAGDIGGGDDGGDGGGADHASGDGGGKGDGRGEEGGKADAFAETWHDSLAVNLTAPVMLTRALLPLLQSRSPSLLSSTLPQSSPQTSNLSNDATSTSRAKSGSVINMTSTRAHQSEPDSEAYAATKAGLLGLTQSLAISLGGGGPGGPGWVRVNAVTLGWINVADECKAADERAEAAADDQTGRKAEGDAAKGDAKTWPATRWENSGGMTAQDHEWHPAGRVGRVEDVARAVEYLSEAEFATGTEMVVAGGVERKMVYPE